MTRDGNIPAGENLFIDAIMGGIIAYSETYGIYSLEILPMEENRVPGAPLFVREFDRLLATARAELRAAGEQTDEEITKPFELAQPPSGVRDNQPIYDALINWLKGMRHTKLSRLSRAVQFLVAWRLMILNDRPPSDPAGTLAILSFSHAWVYWHMEISGVHAMAFYGKSRDEDFTKCTTTKAAKKKTRDAVILEQVEQPLNDGTSCSAIAIRYFPNIDAALRARSCKPFPNPEALAKKLRRMKRRLSGSSSTPNF